MWRLKNISAQNICAFRELSYSPLQGHTTLIFGNNLDNDSQGSNGSGKSALIETFAIALTGETLRKVNSEEIINDACDEAQIVCTLINDSSNDELIVERNLSRSNPQVINITLNGENVVLPSVLEYNRYILNALELTKDDIFSNYILSKYKYSSFLNASDRAKKELINRFSNGVLVDASLEYLSKDIEAAQERVRDCEKRVARAEGRVSTIAEQIDTARSNEAEKQRKKDELIEAHQEAITRLRSKIREYNTEISSNQQALDNLDSVDAKLRELEDSPVNVADSYARIKDIFTSHSFANITLKDYVATAERLNLELAEYEKKAKSSQSNVESYEKEVARACENQEQILTKYEKLQAANTPKAKALKQEIDQANTLIAELTTQNRAILKDSADLHKQIAEIKGVLSGTIECPSCHHKFILHSDVSIDDLNKRLESLNKKLEKNRKTEDANGNKMDEAEHVVKSNRKTMQELDKQVDELAERLRNSKAQTNNLRNTLSQIQSILESEKSKVARIQKEITALRTNMYDEAFDIVDTLTQKSENAIKQAKLNIANAEGNIQSYEDAIKNLREISSATTYEQLEAQKAEYQKELTACNNELDLVNAELTELIQQEARFVDFKTHLANSKIDALGQLTNEFLEAIGSDIRIVFSGYTVLKSGKIRDKISISLLRDGVDCGSFAKFSAGEQCRVNLASILALHKLTNVNCNDDKGLDLLILDEILDATDESGLANMFDALNSLQITSMVVSHGQIAEAYPYRLTVTKQNGISSINELNA